VIPCLCSAIRPLIEYYFQDYPVGAEAESDLDLEAFPSIADVRKDSNGRHESHRLQSDARQVDDLPPREIPILQVSVGVALKELL